VRKTQTNTWEGKEKKGKERKGKDWKEGIDYTRSSGTITGYTKFNTFRRYKMLNKYCHETNVDVDIRGQSVISFNVLPD
jgi:hypothetical protein